MSSKAAGSIWAVIALGWIGFAYTQYAIGSTFGIGVGLVLFVLHAALAAMWLARHYRSRDATARDSGHSDSRPSEGSADEDGA